MAFQVGWSSCDITPEKPVFVSGQFHTRVSEGVMDPITANVVVMESDESDTGGVVMVSCDVVCISDTLYKALRSKTTKLLPEIKPENIIINATHTHTAPELRPDNDSPFVRTGMDDVQKADNGVHNIPGLKELEKDVIPPAEYVDWAASIIADTIAKAWNERKPSGIGYGLGQAVVGHNRRVTYNNGESRMYGSTSEPEFSHIEGYEDHSINLLCTWDKDKKLTGMIINIACPSQDDEGLFVLSADYWHNVRTELRKRFGDDLQILAQPSAAGDQSPHLLLNRTAEERMFKLMNITHRQELAIRIADSISRILPFIEKQIDWNPVFKHKSEVVDLPRRLLNKQDLDGAAEEANQLRKRYEELVAEFNTNPEKYSKKDWYIQITSCFRMMRWNEAVADRYALEQTEPTIPFELHALRIGDIAMAHDPFEYYLDYGFRIKAHSKAIQTFVVQLTGGGTYLPTERAIAGKSYGAVAASTPVGPEGGRKVVEWSVESINEFFSQGDNKAVGWW